ncbi:flagellar hook assembly protein FlgD [Sinomonas atrocyanea]|uniref:flagellar hook assembly protein FlgD n=1 Tax=Sinomonas atrocyanea TaxID=37927 RepID=UPI002788A3CC|nr:flagellar hook capping FlgD N-terminal domain-containing protein [Sinomonas atrocyanea]MDQ0261025.1 flagellar basal-body rod modification protein FlgD [Sinomonas atrocyanea]MDR6622020.1 flagellar basal-body rod modification protein FlgD [Sinomonas atrocyanea]
MSTSPIGSVGSPIGPVGSTSLTSSAPVRAPKQTMDSTVFMDLLVTQLKNQDPSSPMDTNAMINQTTQLSMMEKLTQLATDSAQGLSMQQRAAAAALIGKAVTYLGADGSAAVGTPSSVSYTGSAPTVTIGGASVPLDAITGLTGA